MIFRLLPYLLIPKVELNTNLPNLVGQDVPASPVSPGRVEKIRELFNNEFNILLPRKALNYARQTAKDGSLYENVVIIQKFPNYIVQEGKYVGSWLASLRAWKLKWRTC